jgi:peptidoglycan/xylan/chitin deacetylase (PgdA/CDA1 family)
MYKTANVIICGILVAVSWFVLYLDTDNSVTIAAPLYNGNTDNKNISLMINVYYDPNNTLPRIIETLNTAGASATFFVGGCWAVKNIALTKMIAEKHELGNHGFTHKDLASSNKSLIENEISSCHDAVKSITGISMNLFAPPSMSYNKNTLAVAEKLGYKTILRTEGKDTIDWRDQDPNLIFTRATKNIKGGDLILMHPTAATLSALPRIIAHYYELGFNVVRVSENLA